MTFEELLERARAFQESRVLLTAIELDVFSAVGDGATASQVAGRIGADPRATEMLLNALAAIGALAKRENIFYNTPATAEHLAGPGSQRAGLMHTVNLWERWSTLTAAVRAGTAVWRRRQDVSETEWTEAFIAAMHRNALLRAPEVIKAIDARNVRRLLDVGGGSGAYSIAFAREYPQLEAEILDRPQVLPLALGYIREAGLEGRIRVRAGDLRADQFGTGYDLVLVFAICHMLSPEENRDLFRRIFSALAPGGRVAVQDFILNADKTAPREGALFSLNMLVGTEAGASYSELEYRAWLEQAGFREIRMVSLEKAPSSLMLAVRP